MFLSLLSFVIAGLVPAIPIIRHDCAFLILLTDRRGIGSRESSNWRDSRLSTLGAAMDLQHSVSIERRFAAYVDGLVQVIGRADRAERLRDYCVGLVMPCERKSVEPIAALTAPERVAAQHQSLLHFVGQSAWSDEEVMSKVRELVLPAIERHGPIEAWIIDDTSFPKQGRHSVGVARQYCGELGKTDNCQAAVTLSVANHAASLPVAYRLYRHGSGLRMRRGAVRPAFPRRSSLPARRRSHWHRSKRRVRQALRAGSCSWTMATAAALSCARA